MMLRTTPLLVLLILLAGCTGTTLVDRMPIAVETVTWVLDNVSEDLESAKADVADLEKLPDSARAMLDVDYRDLKKRAAEVRRLLQQAEADVDVDALRSATRELDVLNHLVVAYRSTVLIAEAAATGKLP